MVSDTWPGGGKALVTGATGFIGSRLCDQLRADGVEVHALSRKPPDLDPGLTWHRCDLTDAPRLKALVDEVAPDTVFHLASQVSGRSGHELVRPMLENNLLGTVNLLSAVQDTGCRRMVLTGTVVEPTEDVPASSPYAAAKGAASDHARMFHALYGTPVVCLRLPMVYGPGQEDRSKVIPYAIESMLRGEPPKISNGRWEVEWVFVDDVVDALMKAAVADGVEGHTLDLGSGELASVRDVVDRLAAITDAGVAPSLGALDDRPAEPSAKGDLQRTLACIGWSPRTPLQDGLATTVRWYRDRLPTLLLVAASVLSTT